MAKNVLTVRIGLNASKFTRNLNKLKKQIDTTFGKDAVAGSTALMNKLKWLSAGARSERQVSQPDFQIPYYSLLLKRSNVYLLFPLYDKLHIRETKGDGALGGLFIDSL